MLSSIRAILLLILAAHVLIASFGHSISFHLCGGELENLSLFGKAPVCEQHFTGCHHDQKAGDVALAHDGCCEDATVIIDFDKYSSKPTEIQATNSLSYSIPTAIVRPIETSVLSSDAPKWCIAYRPPAIERDITVLAHSFLI